MTDKWFCTPKEHAGSPKSVLGPMDFAALQRLAASGQLQPIDFVFREGMTAWVAAQCIESLFPSVLAPSDAPGPTALPQNPPGPDLRYWLMIDGLPHGPLPADNIRARLKAGQVTPATLVCPEGGSEWTPLASAIPSTSVQDATPNRAPAGVWPQPALPESTSVLGQSQQACPIPTTFNPAAARTQN